MLRSLSCLAIAATACLVSTSARAQAPMDDALWVASRGSTTLTKYSRFGEVESTVDMTSNGQSLRGVFRAPDGKLWLVNYIATTFTILDRNGKVIKNITAKNSGRPFAIAFDKRGYAFISQTTSNTVDEYKPDGTFVQSISVPANPLGIAIDYSTPSQSGNVWVAHRGGPPGQVSKIDIATAKVTTYTLPTTSAMLPTAVLCTYEGIAKPSNVWVGGDRSDKLWKIDQSGNFTGPFSTASGFSYPTGMAIDRNNRIWAVGRTGVCVVLDSATGKVLKQFNVAPANSSCGGIVMDSIGRPWAMDRNSSAAGTFQRYDDQGTLELGTKAGSNTYGMVDAAGFSYAFVTNPFGDEDADGAANFVEITGGTSPYDPLSTPKLSFDTRGVSRIGKTPYLDAISSSNGTMVVIFSLLTSKGLTIPGISGQFLLDLPSVFYTIALPSPGKLNLPVPNNPALVGLSYKLQGLFIGAGFEFTNVSGIFISQ